jgi:hypothetical protein
VFDNVEFASPIVHDLARKQDRFDIFIHVRADKFQDHPAH